eukprot:scaffold28233_cov112-Isochrysis_galbana.AAC.4
MARRLWCVKLRRKPGIRSLKAGHIVPYLSPTAPRVAGDSSCGMFSTWSASQLSPGCSRAQCWSSLGLWIYPTARPPISPISARGSSHALSLPFAPEAIGRAGSTGESGSDCQLARARSGESAAGREVAAAGWIGRRQVVPCQ